MEPNTYFIAAFMIIATICVVGCIISAMLVTLEYFHSKKEFEKELKHLKEERDACRELLKQRSTSSG